MIWKYNDDYRDEFSKGPHRDILIVPHATKVTPVPGGPPNITNRRPIFDWDENTEKYYPRKEGNKFVLDDVDWVIDNSVLVKEKFKYHYSLNSEQNLTFSSCNAAMVQFTIRNKKEYVEELDEDDQPTGNWYWEQEIPNLYKQEFTMKNPNGTERIVTGEVLSHACIKVYTYINGDSSTLLYLGMFTVEEDRLVDNGYNREITAYDFLATFRDMDVFNWYQNLFKGINKLDNQFEDATNESGEEQTKPEDYDSPKNWVREPREKWTIKEALVDLFDNLAAYDLCVWEEIDIKDEDGHSTGETKKVMTKGMTVSNPNEYGRDGYPEGNGYSGFGMPIMLDPDILTKGTKRYIPTDPGENEYERYGYMDILELEFYQNPKIMKSESLSLGKVLEDIGILAGRYPYIRLDQLDDNDYFDPADIPSEGEHAYDSRYNNYERCILTFKPLPSSKDDSDVSKSPDMVFSNHEIAKGFQHEYCDVEDVMIFKIPLDDGTEISYQRLTKEQRVAASKSLLQTFTMPNNMFASYLVTKSDDDETKGMLDKYKKIREDLFGTETSNGNMSSNAKFQQGYLNMKYRTYIPYQLTTYADPVRECGDRILINFEDKITGEIMTLYSYILERDISGIQKMMDTYTANGNVKNPVFGNYRSGLKNNAGNQNKQNSLNNMTPFDLIEYMRNCGYRLLDEPTECSAVFCKGGDGEIDLTKNHIYVTSSYPAETYIKDGDTTNPIIVNDEEITVIDGDYVSVKNYQNDDPIVPIDDWSWEIHTPLYVYTTNNEWKYVGKNINSGIVFFGTNTYNMSGYNELDVFLDHEDNLPTMEEVVDSTCSTLVLKPQSPRNQVDYLTNPNGIWTRYGNIYDVEPTGTLTETTTLEATYGDIADIRIYNEEWEGAFHSFIYQYPGFWSDINIYPDLTKKIESSSKPYVLLKWSDPPDIDDWKPTPAEWEGTVIIRKEDSAPLHRWDGERIVYTKHRDKYKTEGYKDEDIKMDRTYYYGFFPYYTADDSDPDHPLRYYTFTKVIKVDTGNNSISSTIDSIDVSGNTVTIYYTLCKPDVGQFTNIKIYGKIGSNPACDDTDDVVVTVDDATTSKDISDLEYESTYYFCLVTVDTNDERLSSNVESCELVDPVPPELKPYISKMNDIATWKFAWANIPSSYYTGYPRYKTLEYQYPATNYSYSCRVYSETNVRLLQYYDYDGNRISSMYTYNILTLNVTKNSATSYTGRINFGEGSTASIHNLYNPKNWDASWVSIGVSSPESGSVNFWNYGNTGDGDTTVDYVTYTGTLEQVFSWYSDRFRNINIYVDGIQYAKSHYRLV